jgi:hypothetical protein
LVPGGLLVLSGLWVTRLLVTGLLVPAWLRVTALVVGLGAGLPLICLWWVAGLRGMGRVTGRLWWVRGVQGISLRDRAITLLGDNERA